MYTTLMVFKIIFCLRKLKRSILPIELPQQEYSYFICAILFKINHKMRKILFILLIILPVFTFAQTRVKVGNLYYNINGTTATVARNFWNSFTSDYRESLYEIPEHIYYNGVSYTVIGIDDYAFSAYKSETYGLTASGVRTVIIPVLA